jgi:hypothetical protein
MGGVARPHCRTQDQQAGNCRKLFGRKDPHDYLHQTRICHAGRIHNVDGGVTDEMIGVKRSRPSGAGSTSSLCNSEGSAAQTTLRTPVFAH